MSQRTLSKRKVESAPVVEKKRQSRVRYWVKEVVTTGAVLVIVALMLAGGISEPMVGLIVGAVVIVGAAYLTAVPVAEQTASRKITLALYGFAAVWVAVTLAPFWTLVRPGTSVAKTQLEREGAVAKVGKLEAGRYQVIEQVPREAIAGDTRYVISLTSSGDEQRISGDFTRADFGMRSGRRGRGQATSIHSANRDEVRLGGGETTAKLDVLRGSLGAPITVLFYRRAVPWVVWTVLHVLVVLGAASLDALFADRKRRSMITIGAVFTMVFVEVARQSVSPSHIQKPLIGAAIAGIVIAAVGGYAINIIARAIAGKLRARHAVA